MNALSLRGFVKSSGPTYREEQGSESEAFLALFGGDLVVTEGGTETVRPVISWIDCCLHLR